MTREEDEIDRPVGGRTKDDRERADGEPGDDQQRDRAKGGLRRDAMRQVPNGDDDHGHDGGNEQAPGNVGDAHALVRRERREREVRLVQPVPARDPGEDERSGSRGHESREERAPDLLRGDLPACGRHLEQEKCCDQRSPEERGHRRECTREDEELGSCSLQPNQPDRDRAETEPEGDQRGFGAENESEPQSRECGREDAGERDRRDGVCSETFQGRVSTVAR